MGGGGGRGGRGSWAGGRGGSREMDRPWVTPGLRPEILKTKSLAGVGGDGGRREAGVWSRGLETAGVWGLQGSGDCVASIVLSAPGPGAGNRL